MAKKPLSYQQLRTVWYAKLSKSGFEDAEDDKGMLKRWGSDFTRKKSRDSWEAKQSYYRMAEHFLNDHKFDTPREQAIWAYHSEGISVRDIATTLNKLSRTKKTKTNRTTIWQIVKRLEKLMYKLYNVQETND